MYRGDISNDFPKRVLVNIEPILVKEVQKSRKYLVIPVTTEKILYDRFLLNKFFNYSNSTNTNLELIAFGIKEEALELMYNEIDRVGVNPFRYFSVYKNPSKLANDLPYRPEVFGVIDIPENRLMYGKWALDF